MLQNGFLTCFSNINAEKNPKTSNGRLPEIFSFVLVLMKRISLYLQNKIKASIDVILLISYSHKITKSESIFGQNNQTMLHHGDDYLWSVGIYNRHIFFITLESNFLS